MAQFLTRAKQGSVALCEPLVSLRARNNPSTTLDSRIIFSYRPKSPVHVPSGHQPRYDFALSARKVIGIGRSRLLPDIKRVYRLNASFSSGGRSLQ
jgi:hypothetical protein